MDTTTAPGPRRLARLAKEQAGLAEAEMLRVQRAEMARLKEIARGIATYETLLEVVGQIEDPVRRQEIYDFIRPHTSIPAERRISVIEGLNVFEKRQVDARFDKEAMVFRGPREIACVAAALKPHGAPYRVGDFARLGEPAKLTLHQEAGELRGATIYAPNATPEGLSHLIDTLGFTVEVEP